MNETVEITIQQLLDANDGDIAVGLDTALREIFADLSNPAKRNKARVEISR